jgi:hypothetical protein
MVPRREYQDDQRGDYEDLYGEGLGDPLQGGNSKCTTSCDLDVIVGDMPGSVSGERSTPWLESPTRYSIAARGSGAGLYEEQEPIFDL